MFPFPLPPAPRNAKVHEFFCPTVVGGQSSLQTWRKPEGAQFVYFMLLGAGGAGGATDGVSDGGTGGRGGCARFFAPAVLVPDHLMISVGRAGEGAFSGTGTIVMYRTPGDSLVSLMTAGGGGSGSAGANGSDGAAGGSAMTVCGVASFEGALFLSSGVTAGSAVNPSYGYPPLPVGVGGFFLTSPILVSGATASSPSGSTRSAGNGSGASGQDAASTYSPSLGGHGYAAIISW